MTPREGEAFFTSAMTWMPVPPVLLALGAARAARKSRCGAGMERALASMSAGDTDFLRSASLAVLVLMILSRMFIKGVRYGKDIMAPDRSASGKPRRPGFSGPNP